MVSLSLVKGRFSELEAARDCSDEERPKTTDCSEITRLRENCRGVRHRKAAMNSSIFKLYDAGDTAKDAGAKYRFPMPGAVSLQMKHSHISARRFFPRKTVLR
jgi:hypothetical protein